MNQSVLKFSIITIIVLSATFRSNCQNSLPEIFEQGTISEQLKYLEERTRIYENYRAIREDMFQNISKNIIDSLTKAKNRMNELTSHTIELDNQIDSLKKNLDSNHSQLQIMTRTKNSIKLLGIDVQKTTYNSVMWTILAVMIFLLVAGYLSFRQNRAVTLRTKKDLNELREEFEEYRKQSRLAREKMAMSHFHEIRKLKGNWENPGSKHIL